MEITLDQMALYLFLSGTVLSATLMCLGAFFILAPRPVRDLHLGVLVSVGGGLTWWVTTVSFTV